MSRHIGRILISNVSTIFCLTWGNGRLIKWYIPPNPAPEQGLPNSDTRIGYLERILVFIFVWLPCFEMIGFLLIAKAILLFSQSRDDRRYAEHVLLGTFASCLCAILIALATAAIYARLR